MSANSLQSCFTCLRQTDNYLCIAEKDDVSGENVEAVFKKHFWFTKCEYENKTVCTSCWEKIDEFHKFYCEVEKFHDRHIVSEIKSEDEVMITLDDKLHDCQATELITADEENYSRNGIQLSESTSDQKMKVELKTESKDCENFDTDNGANENEFSCAWEEEKISSDLDDNMLSAPSSDRSTEPSSDESEEANSNVPLARRIQAAKMNRMAKRRTGKNQTRKEKSDNDELNVFIRQHMDITCHKCTESGVAESQTFETFYRLRVHFKKVHGSYGYVFCCNRKWSTKTGLAEHLSNHEPMKSDHSRCLECNCIFKDKGSYANHMFLVHTPEDQKQFKCDMCSKAFAAEDLLNSHIKWHEEVEKKNHCCAICNKYFLSARNLENHNLNHHNFGEQSSNSQSIMVEPVTEPSTEVIEETKEEPSKTKNKRTINDITQQDDLIKKFITLNCSKCDFVGETFNKLSYHALKVHNMNSHSVICCDRRFGKRQRLYEHCLRHLNPDHFKCDICGKTYADSSGLQIHKWWIHTPVSERPFKCDICGAAFVKDYLLKQHTNWHVNKERKTHFCEICNKAYSNSLQLKAHQQKKHGAVCDWVCDICAKGFIHRALLEEHRLTHTEEGLASLKIQCEKCQKWLINKKSYLRHKRRCYDTNGPVKCDVCGKESVNEAALMGHKNFHHSNRPMFTCSYCGKECKTQLRLKEHEATHTGVVLYQCPYCPRTSNSSSNMYTHKKSAHPDKWMEEVAARYYTR